MWLYGRIVTFDVNFHLYIGGIYIKIDAEPDKVSENI